MNPHHSSLQRPSLQKPSALVAAALFLVLMSAARADDAELFLSDPDTSSTRANVLFVIDTSSSMDTPVDTQESFSTSQTYSGCFDSDSLYFSSNASIPACDSPNLLPKSVNRCTASTQQLTQTGYYSDDLLGWDASRKRWDALSADRPTGPVECETDRGVDGDGSGAETYAANGTEDPWADTSATEPAWTNQYTVYDGNWLNWRSNPPTIQKTRLEIVKEAVNGVIAGLRDVNVGIMRFNGGEGGAVVAALEDIETSRESITAIVNGLTTGVRTPLSGTLYEAGQLFMGRNVDYGNSSSIKSVAASRVGNTITSPLYLSPISESCSKNFVILLTDGEPAGDTSAVSKITALPDFATVTGAAACNGTGEGRCLDDMAAYLLGKDLDPALPGLQNVVTHTIGFEVDFPLLVATATRGGGEYHLADDTASLSTALSGIVLSIFDNAGTFAAPTVPVNAFNRTQNLSDVFISVFQPSDTARWVGNLKKYRLDDGVLVGQDGRAVIDPVTGLFARDAFSFWSAQPDGDRVGAGGAASKLPAASARLLYTNLVDGNLSSAANRVRSGTTGLGEAMSAVPATERDDVIAWALGQDVRDADADGNTSETRRDMGDPFHVQPVTVFYSGTLGEPVASVFLTTNDGYLHAFNAATGEERWAFIPQRLLNGLYPLYRNEAAPAKTYGLDGEVNLVIINDDGQPGLAGAERAILLFGMGRGGDGVFAVDVTQRDEPRLLWEISSANNAFADLGQTWSPPVAARVRVGETVHDVAVFGGGYDPGQDNGTFRQDTVGNAIYMVNLQTGARLWSVGSDLAVGPHELQMPDMRYSIPAPVKPLDLNGDGVAERFYVGDMGGQLWRFDIVNGASGSSLVEGGVLASLGGAAVTDPATADLRRFYEAPDVVPIILDNKFLLAINIGSGYRGHPLDTEIDEAFFSVRDFNPYGVIDTSDYPSTPVSANQLADITSDAEPELSFSAAGWMLRLVEGDGEKMLGESITVDNTTFFTSFTPGATATECTGGAGINRLYAISVYDGRPRTNFDRSVDDPLSVTDRSLILKSGIPISDVSVYRTSEGPVVCAGLECLDDEDAGILAQSPVKRTYWFQREGQ